jgi:glucosamine-6-phosphate deaminase
MAVDLTFEYELADFISFRDRAVCERVRRIRRSELAKHENPDFRIQIVDDPGDFSCAFADDIIGRIRAAAEAGRDFVGIFPVGPMPQYELAARRINSERLSCRHVHSCNMDEYANADGETAPPSWFGSFQRAMMERFFGLIDPELRPREENVHFPTREKLGDYSR